MGIMYKLMKHRNLTMDLKKPSTNNKTNTRSDCTRFITIEGNIIEVLPLPAGANADSSEEDLIRNIDSSKGREFTAEHIIQLCKFLAEKSKRNKSPYKHQQSSKKLNKTKQPAFQFQPMEYDDNDNGVEFYQKEALPLLSKNRQRKRHAEPVNKKYDECEQLKASEILSTRLSTDINSLNISSNVTTTVAYTLTQHNHHQQQRQQQQLQPSLTQNQEKRDILLKIRRQIFERKRMREDEAFQHQVLNDSQVWRPW